MQTQKPLWERWIFLLQVKSRPGVLSAITAVFADRGLSIETLTAHDSSRTDDAHGTILLTFDAPESKKDYLARLLVRSATVQSLSQYRYDDAAHARKTILLRVTLSADTLRQSLPGEILCDVVSEDPDETRALLLGPPHQLDLAVAALPIESVREASEPNLTVI
jgi:acetolactate synthase small subunit